MDQGQLTGVFCERPQNFAWFLGAGSSRSSGLPTAMDIIWDLKRRYYCREENEDISRQEVQIEAIRTRIQEYMISKGFPEEWAPEEYTSYFEKIFGTDKERQRQYLRGILAEDKASLSVGNRVLGAFLSSGLTRAVFTTNFDSIVEKSVAEVSGSSISAYHLEGASSAKQALNNEEFPIYCKLHGDFRYDSIKNLAEDLLTQNHDFAECMKVASSRFGFIVAGYSGRDASIIALFKEALEGQNPFPHGFYWTGIKGSKAPPVVKELIELALAKGVKAAYVEVETFDALMLRLWRNTTNKKNGLDQKVRKSDITKTSIPLGNAGGGKPLLRLNALPLKDIPTICNSLVFDSPKQWSDLKEAQRKASGRLLLTKAEQVLCWGSESDIRSSFPDIKTIEPFDFKELLESLENNLPLSLALSRDDIINVVLNPQDVPDGPLEQRLDVTYKAGTDYWLYCVSSAVEPRLFVDFQADSCVIIKDKDQFQRLLTLQSGTNFPNTGYRQGKAVYIDPLLPSTIEIDVPMSKHFRYEYQSEYRFVWKPVKPLTNLSYVELKLGSLESIAELVVL